MNITYDSSGTGQQIQWAKDGVANCGFDLGLFTFNLTFKWADQLPQSSDIGHLHSYMVTQSDGAGGWIIWIEKWADDPLNPNNSGLAGVSLATPGDVSGSNEVQQGNGVSMTTLHGFYMESVVHELGHVVSLNQITTSDEIQKVCALFWTPDMNGGSGRRFGVPDDWNATVWAENIKEAVAEQFKIVYYKGQLIFRNRTQWHLGQNNWNVLWASFMPPYKTLWTNTSMEAELQAGGSPSIDSTGDPGGIQNLSNDANQAAGGYAALAAFAFGPVVVPPGEPAPPHAPGGTWQWNLGIVIFDPANPSVQSEFAFIAMTGEILDVSEYPLGGPYNNVQVTCGVSPGITLLSNAPGTPEAQLVTIGVKRTDNPIDFLVEFAVNGGVIASHLVEIPEGQDVLGITWQGSQSQIPLGYADMQAGAVAWIEGASFTPPPYPGGPDSGDIAVGLGYRGAVILG